MGISERQSKTVRAAGLRVALVEAVRALWTLVVPVVCAGCGVDGLTLCGVCRGTLDAPMAWRVADAREGAAADTVDDTVGDTCGPAARRSAAQADGHAATSYGPVVAKIVLAYKNGGRTDLAPMLSEALRLAVVAAIDDAARRSDGIPAPGAARGRGGVELVSIPATRAAFVARGFHPVDALLRRSGLRSSRVLRWTRRTADQRGLGRAARSANLDGALCARLDLTGRVFIVVDDVVTTGSTVREAMRAVSVAGGAVVAVAALARADSLGRMMDVSYEVGER